MIDVPTLVMHGDDDQIVPIADFCPALGEAAEEQHAQDIREASSRHVHDQCRRREPRPSRFHQGVKGVLSRRESCARQLVIDETPVRVGKET